MLKEVSNLVAKPIVKDQLWVVTNGQEKVGNVENTGQGYCVTLGNHQCNFDSTNTINKLVAIEFQRPSAKKLTQTPPYAVWPTSSKTYNNMFDVKRRLHVYTKIRKSKCYYVAGWFKLLINNEWQTIFCPKYIFVQRYKYLGPYNTEQELESK